MALVLDGRVLIAPTINGAIPNGKVQITGAFTVSEVKTVAASIREATGADDAHAEALRALRASVDLSTPHSAAATLLRASSLRDWLTVTRVFHPVALHTVREAAEQALVLEGDSVRSGLTDSVLPTAVRDILGEAPPGPDWSDFTDHQVAALVWGVVPAVQGLWERIEVVGTLRASTEVAYAVFQPTEAPDEEEGASAAGVLEFRQVGGEWRLLLPAGGF